MTPHEKAHAGLRMLKEAILETLRDHHDSMTNSEIAEDLEIPSDILGEQRNVLSWAVLGAMLKDGEVERLGRKYMIPGSGAGGQPTI
jgi:hypothetical protein